MADFIASILKGEGGSTNAAIGDAAYSEHLVELGNEYDHNLFSIFDAPVEETKEVYERIKIDRDALRDATAALASAPLLNEPAAD